MPRRRPVLAGLTGALLMNVVATFTSVASADPLQAAFDTPPQSAKPWVYWYFMDGHISREGLTKDLEAMKKAGIGGAIFLTVNIGVPKPKQPVEFMSPEWQQLYGHMIKEADRLGIAISLGVGPGWSGDGGPWLKPEETMQHLVASVTPVTGGARVDTVLPRPVQREPFFGRATLSQKWMLDAWQNFYHDECVLAYPTPKQQAAVPYVDEKALYFRAPYSSRANVRPFFDAPATPEAVPAAACLDRDKAIDLTDKLDKAGRLQWDAPPGEWTVYRFGRTLQGQNTRPSPSAGLGFESDKFNAAALAAHAKAFLQPLIDRAGKPSGPDRGLTTLHLDSWEMGSQNWTAGFREKFKARRGYDPVPYLPAMVGQYVTDAATTERFLWDLRQTARELIHDEHLTVLSDYAHKNGLRFSTEGYDMNPAGDLMTLGTGDVQMCEFWSQGFGFSTEFSVFEATSAAHTKGQPQIGAEAFTSTAEDRWQQNPSSMKRQGDWAFAAGVNGFVFHRYQHQPRENEFPGQRMGPYGVFWERTQTWWDMVPAYHQYVARVSAVLRQGTPVADILYLAPEGAPHVFRAPKSATVTQAGLPDRRGYTFDGIDPDRLMAATVVDGRVTLPGSPSYSVLVLPKYDTMTLPLLKKVKALLDAGATVIGPRPLRSPGWGSRGDDAEIEKMSGEMWADVPPDGKRVGSGLLVNDADRRPTTATPNVLWGGKWIWADDGQKGPVAQPGECFFEAKMDLDSLAGVESAELVMRVDDAFTATVNGQDVGSGTDLRELYRFDVTKQIKAGQNVLYVAARNTGDAASPAGLLGGLLVHYRDGRTLAMRSDAAWLSATTRDGVKKKSELLSGLPDVWFKSQPAPSFGDLYVDYDTTARVLGARGLPPDFEADVPLRCGHRRDGDADVYFVANPSDKAVVAACTFRVAGKSAEWWDPISGQRRPLPQLTESAGRTTAQLPLESLGSGFVVFRPASSTPAAPGTTNLRPESVVATLDGPWDVAFDTRWGGPAAIKLTTLDDWSKRPEPGVRNYSGRAVYRTTFRVPAGGATPNVLSLGDVKVMARVRLNGKDLGTVWCVPWSLDVPAGMIKPGDNTLEVTVANLWINRLIGDAALPEGQRLTKTTSNPYKATDPLQPSGLLGPVQLKSRGG